MRYYEASPVIAPAPAAVRAVLTEGAAWPWWDSGVGGADGQMPLGLFGGVRAFEVSPEGNGGSVLPVREQYAGPLPGLIWRLMPDLGPSSGRFGRGVRRRAGTGR
jgi:hypothetical protein